MSFESRTAKVRTFLTNRAQLRRLTTFREVRRALQRRYVARDDIAELLSAVDDATLEEHGVMLSALVVHYWDNNPGHRFIAQARARGLLMAEEGDREADLEFHRQMLAKVYEAYPEFGAVPDNVSELDDEVQTTEA